MPGEHVWIKDMDRYGTIQAQAQTPRSYIVQTQRGVVQRNRRHLLPTPVAPEAEAAPEDVEAPEDVAVPADQPTDEPVAVDPPVAIELGPRRNPSRDKKLPSYLSDYNVAV